VLERSIVAFQEPAYRAWILGSITLALVTPIRAKGTAAPFRFSSFTWLVVITARWTVTFFTRLFAIAIAIVIIIVIVIVIVIAIAIALVVFRGIHSRLLEFEWNLAGVLPHSPVLKHGIYVLLVEVMEPC
jgi:hypothetical protein